MDIGTWLQKSTQKLRTAGIPTARLDCLVLLEDILNKNRTHLLAHPEDMLSSAQIVELDHNIVRRSAHEPLAYIRGKSEFYGRTFLVDKHVLEPRPESETMIEMLKAVATSALPAKPHIVDVGAGSGALGITAKLELPAAYVDLIEIDRAALAVAKKNINMLSKNMNIFENDLLTNISANYDVVLANLPYVPDEFHINTAAEAEPHIAIFGGPDGLDIYRRLFRQIAVQSHKPSFIFTEALPPQHDLLAAIALKNGMKLTKADDFIQQFESKKG
jgi:release factor glutamine methyltransferase